MKTKDEVFGKFKEFKALIENHSERRIKTLIKDNGGEYTSKCFEAFCKEEQSKFSYDQLELYLSICNEDLEKQCSEKSDEVQLAEVFPRPSSSHIDVPYDWEQLLAYTQSYQ